jgi:hypothetical protein
MQPAPTWLSSHSAWRSGYLKQIEAVEPHADRGSPILEARRRWFCCMERPFKRPIFWSKKTGHGTVFRHSAEKLRPLPVSEQVIGALACGWAGINQQRIGHGGYPWKLALLSVVGSARLSQALQDPEEILYHPHEVSAWGTMHPDEVSSRLHQ